MKAAKRCEWAVGCGKAATVLFPILTAGTGNTTYVALCEHHARVFEKESPNVAKSVNFPERVKAEVKRQLQI